MISPTLKKIVEEELKGADLATKIARVSSGLVDEAMLPIPIKLSVREIWRKTFPRTKEEIDRYNAIQEKFARKNQSYHYEHGGNNIVELAIVPYNGSIPNGYIDVPEKLFSTYEYSHQQVQVVLGDEGIIFRELDNFGVGKIRATNKMILGEICGRKNGIISNPYGAILKSTMNSLLSEPNDFLYLQYSSKFERPNHVFSVVTLIPESHLSLDNWWNENERHFRKGSCPNKEDWADTPLIYATILKPELERQGYILEARK